MPEHAQRRARSGHLVPGPGDEDHRIGEEALHFTKWFMRSKYDLMGRFLGELCQDPSQRDVDTLRARYRRALHHAQRVHVARGVVTFLLALGVIAAATSAVAGVLDVDLPTGFLERAAAVSASASVVLVAARLLLDRYLERCDVAATFLAIELATARGAPAASRAPGSSRDERGARPGSTLA